MTMSKTLDRKKNRLDHVQFDFSTKIVIDALSCVTEPLLSNLSKFLPYVTTITTCNNMEQHVQISTSLAKASRVADTRLTIYTGGHFGVVMNHAGEAGHQPGCVSTWVQRGSTAQVAAETGRCYREHLAGDAPDTRKAVRMQLITEKEETLGQHVT